MIYDFETLQDRRGKDAMAVDAVGMPGGFAPAAPKKGFPGWQQGGGEGAIRRPALLRRFCRTSIITEDMA